MGLIRHNNEALHACPPPSSDEVSAAHAPSSETKPAASLLDAWRGEQDMSKREALIAAIAASQDAAKTDALMRIVEEGDAASRNFAILAWQGLSAHEVLRGAALLESANADARVLALSVLQAAPGRDVEPLLIGLLSTEADVNVCAAAVELLAECGTRAASPALLAARERFADNEFVAFVIDEALRQTGACAE
jgi:HEAT repeat protein